MKLSFYRQHTHTTLWSSFFFQWSHAPDNCLISTILQVPRSVDTQVFYLLALIKGIETLRGTMDWTILNQFSTSTGSRFPSLLLMTRGLHINPFVGAIKHLPVKIDIQKHYHCTSQYTQTPPIMTLHMSWCTQYKSLVSTTSQISLYWDFSLCCVT